MRNYITLKIKDLSVEGINDILNDLGVSPSKLFYDIDCTLKLDMNDLVSKKTKVLYIKRLIDGNYILVATKKASGVSLLTLDYINYLENCNKTNVIYNGVENISNFDISKCSSIKKLRKYIDSYLKVGLDNIYAQVTSDNENVLDWDGIYSDGKPDFTNFYTERVNIFPQEFFLIVGYKNIDNENIDMNAHFIESFEYISLLDSYQGCEYPYEIVKNEILKTNKYKEFKEKSDDLNIDIILDKISANGMASLDEKELDFLNSI